MDERASGPDTIALVAFSVAVLIGGLNFVAVRVSNRELDPFWGAGGRFVASAILFLLLAGAMRVALPRGRGIVAAMSFGLFSFTGFYGFVYWGMLEVGAGVASVIAALAPLLTMLLAIAQRVEPFRMQTVAGAVVGAAGTAIMLLQPSQAAVPLVPALAVLAGTTCAAQGVVIAKRNPSVHPMMMNGLGMLLGGILLLALSLAAGEQWNLPEQPGTQLAVAYLVVFSVLLFRLVFVVVARWTPSATSFLFVMFPVVAVSAGALLLGEPVTLATLVGGLLVMAGVYVGALHRHQAAPAAAGAARDEGRR